MRKILIVYATAGIGHKKAAIAVKKAFDKIARPGVEAAIIDALDYTSGSFKRAYLQSYLTMVNKLPTFWGLSYYLTDNFFINLVVSRVRRLSNWLNSKRFADFLVDSKFDVIVSTHFFASEVVSNLKSAGKINAKLITVMTDYRLHAWWLADLTDVYVVAGEDAKKDLVERGVGPDKIKVLGIPAEPVFSKELGRNDILARTGLKDDVFTILVIGGGFGVGPIEDIVRELDEIEKPLQIVVVCGNNKELVGRLEESRSKMRASIKILGFIDNVYEYMEVSDVLISKSGGITVTESLIKELPMIVISPIIGQETRNCDFLILHGAGIRLNKVSELRDVVCDLMDHPEKLMQIKEQIRSVRKPSACYDAANLAIERAGNG